MSKPQWLNDYAVKLLEKITLGPAIDPTPIQFPFFTSLPIFNHKHNSYMATLSTTSKPRNYLEARKDSNWVQAMQLELEALDSNT